MKTLAAQVISQIADLPINYNLHSSTLFFLNS